MAAEAEVLQVAVPAPLFQPFDYLPPEGGQTVSCPPGCRVRVPFGRRNLVGVVLGPKQHADIPAGALKRVSEVLDAGCVFGPGEVFDLCRWAADYYHHPIGETMMTALPAPLRQGQPAARAPARAWRLAPAGAGVDFEALQKHAPRQAAVLARLPADGSALDEAELRDMPGSWQAALKALAEKGWAERTTLAHRVGEPAPPAPGFDPNRGQLRALEAIRAGGGFDVLLLEGVTGSGKTEVYLRAAEQALARGRQALVLVPEIGLTPQLIQRFRNRLSGGLAVLHSGLRESERLDGWLAARDGEAGVVLGTRSALFTPLARPGLIVVDEEHDGSYKQQEGLRYSARDLAVRRAQMAGVPVLLGSATPSLETLHNARTGRYQHLRLPRRAADASPPALNILDVRGRPMRAGVSEGLLGHARRHLEAGGQVMFFLNRRGYAPTLMCHDCGWVAQCRRCDARMTWHQRDNRLRCHHCGAERAVATLCPDCGGADLIALGQGTERVEAVLKEAFPGHDVVRVDRDTTARRGAFEQLMQAIEARRVNILVGTQMLAKGHHFPGLSLVGVLNADQGLFGADFRATEHMAQLVTQVAGRAGRAERAGEVYIQTHHPAHPLLVRMIRDGYASFAEAALAEREQAGLPPFTHMALLRAESTREQAPLAFLEQAAQALETGAGEGLSLWGPVPAPMERRAGRVRAQLLLQTADRGRLHRALAPWVRRLGQLPAAKRVRWSIDVGPVNLM
jgi:primosomal protein N' (replication factor Y)